MIDQLDRIKAEIADSFDEELEMQMEEDRLDELVAEGMSGPAEPTLERKTYFRELFRLQHELVRLQDWVQYKKLKVVVLFEGRDSAGKGGAIKRVTQRLNPRVCRVVALPAPTEREKNQWYFQRYVSQLPTAGEMVLFDRSWYNRAGVEPVMGFCTPEQYEKFLKETPRFEKMVVSDDIHLFKFWLNIGREMQLKRFHDRRHDPLKVWKLSPMDIAALNKWDDYSQKRDRMLKETHTDHAPWTVIRANDKRRARINLIRHILKTLDYEGKDKKAIGEIDDRIVGSGPGFLK